MKQLIIFILLLPNLIFSQINAVVVNENKQPLSYVNVWNKDLSSGATSNLEGKFFIEKATTKDTLVLSLAGYQTQMISVKEKDTIQLLLKKTENTGLLVYPERTLAHSIGKALRQNLFFSPGNLPWIYVKYFQNDAVNKNIRFIDKVVLFTRSSVADATFKLRILKANSDKTPGADLLIEPVIVHVERGTKKCTINLIDYKLKIPEDGVFVGIEWILSENNRMKLTAFYKDNEPFADYKYTPDLVCNFVEESQAFRYQAGEWKRNDTFIKKSELNEAKPIIEPAIQLILTN